MGPHLISSAWPAGRTSRSGGSTSAVMWTYRYMSYETIHTLHCLTPDTSPQQVASSVIPPSAEGSLNPVSTSPALDVLACLHTRLLQVKVKVNALHGHLPYVKQCCEQLGHFHPTAAFVVAQLSAGGEVLGLETQTTYAETLQEGCSWAEWLTFCVKVGEWVGRRVTANDVGTYLPDDRCSYLGDSAHCANLPLDRTAVGPAAAALAAAAVVNCAKHPATDTFIGSTLPG